VRRPLPIAMSRGAAEGDMAMGKGRRAVCHRHVGDMAMGKGRRAKSAQLLALVAAWLCCSGAGAFGGPPAWTAQSTQGGRRRRASAALCSSEADRAIYRELHRVGGGMFYRGVRGRSSGRGGLFPASDRAALDAFDDMLRVLCPAFRARKPVCWLRLTLARAPL